MRHIGLMGGTFDPVHIGHLRSALEVSEQLQLAEMRLLPAHRPPHRDTPDTPSSERLKMLELAVQDTPQLKADGRELLRDKPSYTVDTLAELRDEFGDQTALTWVMGSDALEQLDQWRQWPRLFELANVLVLNRPGAALNIPRHVSTHCGEPQPINQVTTAGGFWQMALTQLEISSSDIRDRLQGGHSVRYLVPAAVDDYIHSHRLYQQ